MVYDKYMLRNACPNGTMMLTKVDREVACALWPDVEEQTVTTGGTAR